MVNVLIPSMGKSLFFKDSFFPKPVIEVNGKTMLEQVAGNYGELKGRHFVFVFSHKDCVEFHLDEAAKVLIGADADALVLENETAGALCTCLMAVDFINNDDALIVANCDQVIDVDYQKVIEQFEEEGDDAGVITFDSIHPRWSYARIREGRVTEAVEKRPLSRHAIAGVYFFRRGRDFVEAAKRVILKDNHLNGNFYISASLNEIILMGKTVGYYEVPRERYHSFYSPEKIKESETRRGSLVY